MTDLEQLKDLLAIVEGAESWRPKNNTSCAFSTEVIDRNGESRCIEIERRTRHESSSIFSEGSTITVTHALTIFDSGYDPDHSYKTYAYHQITSEDDKTLNDMLSDAYEIARMSSLRNVIESLLIPVDSTQMVLND